MAFGFVKRNVTQNELRSIVNVAEVVPEDLEDLRRYVEARTQVVV